MSESAIAVPVAALPEREATAFGHPRGLVFLAFTEVWERFSFYGMQALLVLYLVDTLLRPDHIGRVAGLVALRTGVERVLGPLSTQAFASEIFGLYGGLVYFTPVFGGLVGDRLLGQRRTVMLGAALMSIGHLLMAFDRSFLIALGFLIVGCGCLKGNISAQVGKLYQPGDPRRTRAFAVFNVAINVGGLFGPFVCGAIGEVYGWRYGFAVAGVLMVLGLITYAAGQRWMPPDSLRRPHDPHPPHPRLNGGDWRLIAALFLMLFIGLFFSIAYYQLSDVYMLWVRATVNRRLFGLTVPVTWFGGIDSFFTIASTPLLIGLWRWQAGRRREPSDLVKIGIASAAVAVAYLMLAALSLGPGQVNMLWPLLFSAVLGTAFVYQWPTTLTLVSRIAPAAVNSTMMGVAFLTLFVSYTVVGWVGGFYERLTPAGFWLLHAGIGGFGAVLVMIFNPLLSRVFALAPDPGHKTP
ncbi:MAG: peptide MFS transporter [Caulobacteraceae bacterium]|nr:peptide MFS transporter [Caulobacteraceae bacterium]